VLRAKILAVDKVRWTCSVQSEHGNRRLEGISIQPTFMNTSGGGQFFMPETGSIVWLCFPSEGSTPFIMGSAVLPQQQEDGDVGDPTDMRQNRPVLGEGDMLVAASSTGKIILRKGGVLEVGASESAKRVYIPLTNLIREFSQNWEHESGGGRASMLCRPADDTYGPNKTPAEYQIQWREFCEDAAPMIDIRMGRIKDEDTQRVVGGKRGDVVYRMTINERYRLWIDKYGNVQKVHFGTTTEAYVGPRTTSHSKSFTDIVRGMKREIYSSRHTEVAGVQQAIIGKDSITSIGGDQSTVVGGKSYREVEGQDTQEVGGRDIRVRGAMTCSVLGDRADTVAGDATRATGQSVGETVGGVYQMDVANSAGAGESWSVSVASGDAVIHNKLGIVQFSSGGLPSAAACVARLKPSGSILLQSSLGLVEVEVNKKGVRVKSAGGEISLDLAGTVTLGPSGRGNVITTATHPVDYVTGAPILGSSSVRAGGLPAPSGVSIPSTFVKDRT